MPVVPNISDNWPEHDGGDVYEPNAFFGPSGAGLGLRLNNGIPIGKTRTQNERPETYMPPPHVESDCESSGSSPAPRPKPQHSRRASMPTPPPPGWKSTTTTHPLQQPKNKPPPANETEEQVLHRNSDLLDVPLNEEEVAFVFEKLLSIVKPKFRFNHECKVEANRVQHVLASQGPKARMIRKWWDEQATEEERTIAPMEFVKWRWQQLGIWDPAWDMTLPVPRPGLRKVQFTKLGEGWDWKWNEHIKPNAMSEREILRQLVDARRHFTYGEHRPLPARSVLTENSTRGHALSYLSSRPWLIHALEEEEDSVRLERLPSKDARKVNSTAPERVHRRWVTLGIWDRNWESFHNPRDTYVIPGWRWRSESPEPDPQMMCQLLRLATTTPESDIPPPPPKKPMPEGDITWRLPKISSSDEVYAVVQGGDWSQLVIMVNTKDSRGALLETRCYLQPTSKKRLEIPDLSEVKRKHSRKRSEERAKEAENSNMWLSPPVRDRSQSRSRSHSRSQSGPRTRNPSPPDRTTATSKTRDYTSRRSSLSPTRRTMPHTAIPKTETPLPAGVRHIPATSAMILSPRVVDAVPSDDYFRSRRPRRYATSSLRGDRKWSKWLDSDTAYYDERVPLRGRFMKKWMR